jgi:hypothetical protein
MEEREIEKEKKPYEKPKITRIKLDAKTAVLGVCKTAGAGGPSGTGCEVYSASCLDYGS